MCVCMVSQFSRVQLFVALWTIAHQAPLSMGFSRQKYWSELPCPPLEDLPHPGIELCLFFLMHYQAVSLPLTPPGKRCYFCSCSVAAPPFPPALIFPSIRIFSNESALQIRWPKYWNFSFSISPSNEYSGLISFRIDWFDLLAVQGMLKSLLQHHNSKASIVWCLVAN